MAYKKAESEGGGREKRGLFGGHGGEMEMVEAALETSMQTGEKKIEIKVNDCPSPFCLARENKDRMIW